MFALKEIDCSVFLEQFQLYYQIPLYDTMLVLAIVLLVSPIIISSEFFFIGISIVSKKSFLDLPFLSMMQYIISSMMEAGVSSLIVMMMAYESTVMLASITSIELLLLMEPRSTVVMAVGESSERKKMLLAPVTWRSL